MGDINTSGGRGRTQDDASTLQVNGGRGFWTGPSPDLATTREMLPGPGMDITNTTGFGGSPRFTVKPAEFEIAKATINGAGGPQKILLLHGQIEAVEYTTASFRLFSAQPSALRGGLYTAPKYNGVSQPGAMLVPDTMSYEDWNGPYGVKTIPISQYRRPVFLWWIPTVAEAVTFEISVRGLPVWFKTAGQKMAGL